jgi:hypothetical protein
LRVDFRDLFPFGESSSAKVAWLWSRLMFERAVFAPAGRPLVCASASRSVRS